MKDQLNRDKLIKSLNNIQSKKTGQSLKEYFFSSVSLSVYLQHNIVSSKAKTILIQHFRLVNKIYFIKAICL